MELCRTNKIVCKYCNKIYPCGKSLGGHLRSHNTVNLVGDEEKAEQTKIGAETDGQEQYGCVVRGKIGNAWRFLDSANACKQELKICKECGKEFKSVKALSGHMACHSEKEKQKEKMYVDSDTESSGPMLQRRSRRLRFKTLAVHSSSALVANAGSSLSSKIEQEQEEVALCLLMLSRDIGNWDDVDSYSESSDNNSGKLSADMNITTENRLICASNVSKLDRRNNERRERKSINARIDLLDDSDSDYFETGVNKINMDVSTDMFLSNDQIGLSTVKCGFEFQDFSARSRKRSNESGTIKSSLGKSFIEEEYKRYRPSSKNVAGIGGTDDFSGLRVVENFYRKIKIDSSSGAKVNRDGYYESIGTSNKNIVGTKHCSAKTPDRKLKKSYIPASGKNLLNNDVKKSWRSKGYKCPFCPKIFRSGQALGGHKRIHFLSGSGDRTFVIKQEIPSLLDLNFPPPDSDEVNGNSSFMPW